MLSQAIEDYLKTIYKLESTADSGGASTSDIAREMNVTPSSASNMVKRLAGMHLVEYQAYRGVSLTDAGRKIALEIIRHHRLLETYLREVMGFDWDQMHAEAELLEHHISEEFEDRIEALLGFPTHDPHGHPIPSREGVVEQVPSSPISPDLVGERVSVVRLDDRDPERLRLLESAGLLPGATVEIEEDADPEYLVVVSGSERTRLPLELAGHVFVSQPEA